MEKEIKQLAFDAIEFIRDLQEDGTFWQEGYNKQVAEELQEDAKRIGLIK